MKVRVHGKNLPKKFRLGAYAMTELTLRDLLGKSRVIKNLEIDIHFRHHADNGEAMIHENEFRSIWPSAGTAAGHCGTFQLFH